MEARGGRGQHTLRANTGRCSHAGATHCVQVRRRSHAVTQTRRRRCRRSHAVGTDTRTRARAREGSITHTQRTGTGTGTGTRKGGAGTTQTQALRHRRKRWAGRRKEATECQGDPRTHRPGCGRGGAVKRPMRCAILMGGAVQDGGQQRTRGGRVQPVRTLALGGLGSVLVAAGTVLLTGPF